MSSSSRRDHRRATNIWPGFVDALSTLLLVVIFVLMVFMVAQFFLSTALTGKNEELSDLDQQLIQLGELLALERSANAELRINITQLSSELQSTLAVKDEVSAQLQGLKADKQSLTDQLATLLARRDALAARVDSLTAERDDLRLSLGDRDARLAESDSQLTSLESDLSAMKSKVSGLDAKLAQAAQEMSDGEARELALKKRLAMMRDELSEAYGSLEADKEKIQAQLTELAVMRELRDELDKQLATRERLLAALTAEKQQLTLDLDNSRSDQAALNSRLANREAELAALANRLATTSDFALEQQQLNDEAQRKLDLLNRQMASLRRQMASLNAALDASETRNEAQAVQIIDLGKRLNVALASKVQELAGFRSEFFGRLRKVLGDNPNIAIVGDRFVFQAEVLFHSSQAVLDPEGQKQIASVAQSLLAVASKIPDDIDWVLRVDGHTDNRPIATAQFPSNWELSSARAITVVKFLIEQGLPARRLVAAGFGEFQPIDPGENEAAYRRNRRIEFKLTTR
jgi:chemotaxis protein MotB|tara:strand:- start:806 stop:2359 length:1554 start_codon:yes stop_codon:yes gene_type:complete